MFKNNNSYVFELMLGWILIILSVILLCLITYKSIYDPINFDEAYNLQIADSLSKGDGYASYGTLRGDGPWLFDPHITTGPAILIPLAAIWAASDGSILAIRIFMASFLWVYAASLYFLLKQSGGKLFILALSLAAFLCIYDLPTGKVLGELPAAAALILAAVLISKNRYILAALVVGVAIQIKFVYGLAGLVVLSSIFIYWIFIGENVKIKTIALIALLLATPTILFECYRYISFFDLNLYLYSIEEFNSFLRMQNINNISTWINPAPIGTKFYNLYHSVSFFAWVAIGLTTMSLIFSASIDINANTSRRDNQQEKNSEKHAFNLNKKVRIVLVMLSFAGVSILCGWITQSVNLSARQGLPFLLLFFPAISALGGSFFVALTRQRETKKSILGIFFIFLISGLLIFSLAHNIKLSINKGHDLYMEDQNRVVSILKNENPKSILSDDWWQNPEYQILTKITAIPFKTGDSQILIVQDYQAKHFNSNLDSYKNMCSKIIYSSQWNLVCWLPEYKYRDISLLVLDWSPKITKLGYVPNQQPDGGAGISIKIKKIDAQAIGPVRVYFDQVPSRLTYLHPAGELITASMPSRLFKTAGSYEVSLRQIATGRSFHVGNFIVK